MQGILQAFNCTITIQAAKTKVTEINKGFYEYRKKKKQTQQLHAANTKTAETGTRRRKIRNYSSTRK
jgi:hypothetical protein